MGASHPWPNAQYLNPPRRYTTCWRCGIEVRLDYKPRACRDCASLLATTSERLIWSETA